MSGWVRSLAWLIAVVALSFPVACSDEPLSLPPSLPPAMGEVLGQITAEENESQASAVEATQAAAAQPRTRPKVIALDPGHGGPEVGAVHPGSRGRPPLTEKDSNLDMAFRLRSLLEAAGYQVVLTRETDRRATGESTGPTAFPATRLDLQRRIDIANEAGADLFISLHSNGSPNPAESGVEVWYDPNRPFGAENVRLAGLVQRHILESLAAYGYRARDRGIKDDTTFRFFNGRYIPLFVLGPPRETTRTEVIRRGARPEDVGFPPDADVMMTRATQMPGVLVEMLFLTNDADAEVLRDPAGRDAIARGIRDAINAFFGATE